MISREALERFAAKHKPANGNGHATGGRGIAESADTLTAYLEEHGVTVKHVKAQADKTVLVLAGCPMNTDHGKGSDTAVVLRADGQIGFECKHDHCTSTTWPEVRRRIDPTYGTVTTSTVTAVTTATPRPAAPVIEPYTPFPIDVLPDPARAFAVETARAMGCDPAFVALPLLSVLGAAIGNTRRIQLKRGWTERPIIWTGVVAESGSLKSPAGEAATQPIRRRQAEALKRHAEAMSAFRVQQQQYEKQLALWKRTRKDQGDPPIAPEPPAAERFIVSDVTVEALAPILLANPRGVLSARDELAGWLGSFDRYAGKGGADAAHWLSMHRGESLIVDRKTGVVKTIFVPSAAVWLTGGIQPGVLHRAIGQEHRESGMLARLLLAMPPRIPKTWTEAEVSLVTQQMLEAVLDQLYSLRPNLDEDGTPHPVTVPLSPEGLREWAAFFNAHAREQAELAGDLAAAWSKLEGYAARLALVTHFTRWAAADADLRDPDAVDEHSIRSGVTLSRWFGAEARRIYAVLGESDEDRQARQLLEVIRGKGGAVRVRDWQRARHHKSTDAAEAELNSLVAAGYGTWAIPKQVGCARPGKVFVTHCDTGDSDKHPSGAIENGGIVTVTSVTSSENNISEPNWGDL